MDLLTDVGVAVVSEVKTSALDKIKQHVAYLYNYHDNLNALREADGLLVAKISDESKFSGEAGRSVRDVSATIVNWRSKSKELHQEAEKLLPRNKISHLKPWSRYSTSKHASNLTPKIKENVDSAPDFGTSFDRPTAEGARFNLKSYMEFGSRRRIQNEVLEALRKDDVSICSICGMGGMGKTMMAKKLIQIVEADRLFDKVALVTMTQNPNLEEIQKGIIVCLELKIDDNMSMQGRAKKLNDWLSNNKTLLVLDDVWQQLLDEDFEDMGVPLGAKGCKILITSKYLDECVKMGSDPNISLKDLEEGEAWDLFVQNAGKCVEDTARKIVAECSGLPIAIVTIARALKGKPQGEWNNSLKKLKESNLPGVSDMEKVYSKIQISYSLLNDKEAQACLLLCCLFPEDYNVGIDKLVLYGWGMELFEGVDSLKEARDRVDSIVHKLKNSFLLLDGDENGCVKLHDIVRDFAIFISSKDENPYLVRCEKEMEKWPENCQYEKCRAISFVCDKLKSHPVDLRCPNLNLLHLSFRYDSDMLPNGFFGGMEQLKVIDLEVRSPLPPLSVLRALRTLLIENSLLEKLEPYYFKQMLGEGDRKNLEIFSLSWMRLSEFPVEIGFMRNLRCLKFIVASFDYMPPGVLSNLVKLEELELPLDFNVWGLQENGGSRFNASLDEIASLPLTSITVGLRKSSTLAENIVKRVTRFRIHIEVDEFYSSNFYSNVLLIRKVDACNGLVKWTGSLLRQCHILELNDVELKYIMSQQLGGNNCYQCEYFSQLKDFKIKYMGSLEEILHGPYLSNIEHPCFTNLAKIQIGDCPKLKRAFPLSVARELIQLESMKLADCSEMEEVFYDDQVDNRNQNMEERVEKVGEREADHVILLPRLKVVSLHRMPKLRVVYNGNHAIECPSLEELKIGMCNNMEGLSYGSFSSPGTKKLELERVGHLRNISKGMPLAEENGILHLKELTVAKCDEMKYLADAIAFPNLLKTFFSKLEELIVKNMDSLEKVWHGPYFSKTHVQCFSNLTRIAIYTCPKVKHLFPLPVATQLRQLQDMTIDTCEQIEEIFYKDHVDDEIQVESNVQLNDVAIIKTATMVNPNNDQKSSYVCPTAASFFQCFLPKRKQPKRLPSDQIVEESVEVVDETQVDLVIVFPKLKLICLAYLPKLRVVYNGNNAIDCPSLEHFIIIGCSNMEGISHGSFNGRKSNHIYFNGVRHLKYIPEWIPLKQDNRIPVLKVLDIAKCHEMEHFVDPNLQKTFFSSLEMLEIADMDSLKEIWHGPYMSNVQEKSCFSHLTLIGIEDCPKLKHVFPVSVATGLTQLQQLRVVRCQEMDGIFYNDQVADGDQAARKEYTTKLDGNEVDDAIIFPQLEVLALEDLSELRIFYDGNHAFELPSLRELAIRGCYELEPLSNGPFKAPNLQKIEINGYEYGPCGDDVNFIVKKEKYGRILGGQGRGGQRERQSIVNKMHGCATKELNLDTILFKLRT